MITRDRYNSSSNKYIVSYYLVFKSGIIKRLYSIVSAVSSISLYNTIIFYRVSTLAILLSIIIKIIEYSLECGRKSAKSIAYIIDKLLDYRVVLSILS